MTDQSDVEVEIPFCFVTDYSFVKSKLKLIDAIRDHAHLLLSSGSATRRVMAWRAAPKMRNTLITYGYVILHPFPRWIWRLNDEDLASFFKDSRLTRVRALDEKKKASKKASR